MATTAVAPLARSAWCGVCLTTDLTGDRCPSCGAALVGPVADQLRQAVHDRARLVAWRAAADEELAALDARIDSLVTIARAPQPAPVPAPAPAPPVLPAAVSTVVPAAAVPAAAPSGRHTSPRAVLTWTGGILLALAGIAFAVWAWTAVGPYGRFGMLLAATAATAGTARLVRRRTPVTAESLDMVAVVLLMVDWVVAWNVVGADASPSLARDWLLLGTVVVGAAALGLARATDAVVLPHVGVVLASIGLVGLPFARIIESGPPAEPIGLAALAALSWTSLLPLALGRLTARRWPRTEVTGGTLGALAWLAVLAGCFGAMGVLVTEGMQGAAVSVAALGVPATCVVAWAWLPVAARRSAWTAVHGVAAAAGGCLVLLPIARDVTMALDRVAGAAGAGLLPWLSGAVVATALVAVAVALARLVAASPARTGALAVLLSVAGTIVLTAELGVWAAAAVGTGGGDVPGWARWAVAAAVALGLAVPVVLAAVTLPTRADWRPVLTGAATAALWSPVLLLLAAATAPLGATADVLLVAAAAVAATAVTVLLARRGDVAASGVSAAVIAGLATAAFLLAADDAGVTSAMAAALLVLAALAALVWRAGAGTWLLPRAAAPLPVAAATVLLLAALAVLLDTWLPPVTALVAASAAGLLVWLVAGRVRLLSTTGVVGGAAGATLVAAGLPAVVALAAPLIVPALRSDAATNLPVSDVALLLAASGSWAVLAAAAALAAAGSLVPLPAGVPQRARSAAPAVAAGCGVLAVVVLVTAADLPAWVPAAVLVATCAGTWLALLRVPTGGQAPALAAALACVPLAAGWVAPLAWGPTVLAVVLTVAAGAAAARTTGPVAATAAGVAAVAGVLVAPLVLTAADVAAAGSAVIALAVAAGGAVLLAAAPSLPTADAVRVVVGSVGLLAASTGALLAPDAGVLGLALVLTAAGLLLAARRLPALRYASVAVAVAASWAFLADAGATVLEAWTVPTALGLLLAGWLLTRDPHRPHLRHPSWLTTGPALLVLVVPSATVLLAGAAPTWRLAGLAAVGAVALAAGLGRHEQAPVVLGSVALLAVAAQVLGPVVAEAPLWVVLALAGAFLTWIGFTWERRRDQAHHAAEGWARFV